MDRTRRDFYAFHSALMEPWDGPACITFTDGSVIGAVLDRNGLRPGRWWRTEDDLVVLASEAGVLEIDQAHVVAKGRLQPGKMFLVDTVAGEIVADADIKARLGAEQPYGEWLHAGLVPLEELPAREHVVHTHESVTRRQLLFGYTEEDLRILMTPMAMAGRRAARVHGYGHADGRAVAAAADVLRLLHRAVRPGHQPGAGRDPRAAGHVAVGHHRPGAQPARSRSGVVPADRAAPAGDRQRRPGPDLARQRRR